MIIIVFLSFGRDLRFDIKLTRRRLVVNNVGDDHIIVYVCNQIFNKFIIIVIFLI